MKYKYLVLDFGKVLVSPTTGDWHITPKFQELIDINKIDKNEFNNLVKKYGYILSEKILTLEEEYDMFTRFYDNILKELNYPNYDYEVIKEIAYDRPYNSSKYTLYDNIYNELDNLKNKYKLILLTDNWPCVNNYLKEYKLYDYFDKIYISSIYEALKKDKIFFDYPIKDFNINKGEALFIDDTEENLDAAFEKGFDVLLMDREKVVNNSKYNIIHDLYNI